MFEGIYTPVLTPFGKDGLIDYDNMKHNLDKWAATELAGIVVLGSNGEFVYLTEDEKVNLVGFCIEHFPADKKIIVGTSYESTTETIRFSQLVGAMGADAVLVLPPHYYKGNMTETALEAYFHDVADQCPVPVMLYNMPPNTGINLSAALVARLSNHPNIVGIKDTAGDIVQLAETIRDATQPFSIFAGNAGFLLPALALGANGATVALANIFPEDCCRLITLVADGKWEEARRLQLNLLKVNHMITRGIGVAALKAAADYLGYKGGVPRKPIMPLDEGNRKKLKEALDQYLATQSPC